MKKKVIIENQTVVEVDKTAKVPKRKTTWITIHSNHLFTMKNILHFEEEFNWAIEEFESAFKLALRLKNMAQKTRNEAVAMLKEERKKNDILEERIEKLRRQLDKKTALLEQINAK